MSKKGNRIKRFRFSTLTGGMNTNAEDNALVNMSPEDVGPGYTQIPLEFRKIQNFYPLNRGGLAKAKGFDLFKAMGAGKITGLYEFKLSNGDSYFMVSQGTDLYKLVSGTATSLTSSLENGNYTHFETARDTLVICDAKDSRGPLTWDGVSASTSTLGGSPPNGAKQSLYYQNRLWMFSETSDTSLLYYSDAGNIASGYASNFVNCEVNDGQKITSIAKFYIPGQLQPVILVGKERSFGLVTGDGTVNSPYTFAKIKFDVGVPGFRQIVQFGQDAAFLTPQGPVSYQAAIDSVNLKEAFLSRKIFDQFTGLSTATLPDALCWYDFKNTSIAFAVAHSGNYPDRIWYYDTTLGAWYYQDGFNLTAVWMGSDGTWYHGDKNGNIYLHDGTDNSYDGSAIQGVINTGYMDFFEPDYFKRIVRASIAFRGDGDYGLGVQCYKNFGASNGSSHTLDVEQAIYTWNGGVWTFSSNTYQWGPATIQRVNFFPKGIFKNIAFEFTQSGTDQPIELFELDIEVEYLSQY